MPTPSAGIMSVFTGLRLTSNYSYGRKTLSSGEVTAGGRCRIRTQHVMSLSRPRPTLVPGLLVCELSCLREKAIIYLTHTLGLMCLEPKNWMQTRVWTAVPRLCLLAWLRKHTRGIGGVSGVRLLVLWFPLFPLPVLLCTLLLPSSAQ